MPDGNPSVRPLPSAVHFLHIPKTAGTSVHRFLHLVYPAAIISPARAWEDLESGALTDLGRYRVFSGHWADCLDHLLGLELATITLLRDPVQQTISNYAHVRRDPAQPQHEIAQRLTLAEFCHHDETRYLVENCQCAFLATRIALLPAAADRGFRAQAETAMADNRAGPAALRRALDRLERCAAVGVTERLPATLSLFAERLGRSWNGPTPFENPSYNRPSRIDARTADLIREIANLDVILYREAEKRLEAGLADMAPQRAPAARDMAADPAHKTHGTRDRVPGLRGALRARLDITPEKRFRLKQKLSRAVGRMPVIARLAAAWVYVGYRLAVDQRIGWQARLPLALATGYSAGPLDLIPDQVPAFGYVDNLAALAFGMLWTRALIDRRILTEIKLAAITRFHLDHPIAAPTSIA